MYPKGTSAQLLYKIFRSSTDFAMMNFLKLYVICNFSICQSEALEKRGVFAYFFSIYKFGSLISGQSSSQFASHLPAIFFLWVCIGNRHHHHSRARTHKKKRKKRKNFFLLDLLSFPFLLPTQKVEFLVPLLFLVHFSIYGIGVSLGYVFSMGSKSSCF